jgi:hypothetical protein
LELLVEMEPLELLAGHVRDDVEVLVVVEDREARQLGRRRDQQVDLAGLNASYGLVDAETVANVVLHVTDDEAQVPRQSGMAAAPLAGLDLWESGDARASEEGQRLFAEALETFRER